MNEIRAKYSFILSKEIRWLGKDLDFVYSNSRFLSRTSHNTIERKLKYETLNKINLDQLMTKESLKYANLTLKLYIFFVFFFNDGIFVSFFGEMIYSRI